MDRLLTKSNNWVSIYLVSVALGLTTLGLVMLFSAGAVRGAQALLTKQFIWLGLSIFGGKFHYSLAGLIPTIRPILPSSPTSVSTFF